MNNAFGMPALPQQHNIFAHTQESQHTANVAATGTNLLPSSTGTLAYLHQHPQVTQLNAHPHHLTAISNANGTPANLFDLHKTYFAGTTNARAPANVTGHFFTNADASNTQPRTLLITNAFGQQLQTTPPQPQRNSISNTNTTDNFSSNNHHINFISSPPNAPPQAHIYNINNNVAKDAQQLQAGEVLQQQVYQQHLLQPHNFTQSTLIPQHSTQLTFSKPHFSTEPQHHGIPLPNPIYIASDSCVSTSEKSMPPISNASAITATSSEASNSTVVLDRINICINNHHYTDPLSSGVGTGSPSAVVQLANPTQPASPIIPTIKHKPIITTESDLVLDCSSSNESVLIIDEPDSTTATPQTPPKTPESITKSIGPLSIGNGLATTFEKCSAETSVIRETKSVSMDLNSNGDDCAKILQEVPPEIASLTPATAPTTAKPINFDIGDDVLIKREGNCFYLGTVVDSRSSLSYLVRFDDKSQLWCSPTEMKKLRGSEDISDDQGPRCVSCKQAQQGEVVEICDRCSRGYHRSCTRETEAGNGEWLCKRCMKPMKVRKHESGAEKPKTICRQLPYHAATLNWDERHRVNEEQIYCYCGKSGQFDQNMLQCCKCKNWFHTLCLQEFKYKMWRGDGFFVFCCTVCNDGVEFVRRLQMSWVDLVHIALYNLSASHKHQHQKYHHLVEHIMPFIRKDLEYFPIPQEWKKLANFKFFGKIKETLDDNKGRFICAREGKKDQGYYALRTKGPAVTPKFTVQPYDELSDKFLVSSLKLILFRENLEKSTHEETLETGDSNADSDLEEEDIYNFSADEDTTDDEMPIKHIIDKAKKDISTTTNSTFDLLKRDISTPSNKVKIDTTPNFSIKGETPTIISNEIVQKAPIPTENKLEPISMNENTHKKSVVSGAKTEICNEDGPSVSRKKSGVSAAWGKKFEVLTAATKRSEVSAASSKNVELPAAANNKTDVFGATNKKSEVPVASNKKTEGSTVSNKKSEIPAASSKKFEVSVASNNKSEVCSASSKKSSAPSTPSKKSEVSVASNKKSEVCATSSKKSEAPSTPSKKSEVSSVVATSANINNQPDHLGKSILRSTKKENKKPDNENKSHPKIHTDIILDITSEPKLDRTSESTVDVTTEPSVSLISEPTESLRTRSRKRKLCGIRPSYKEFAIEPHAKRLSCSSEENSNGNRKLDKIIPEPQNFLGLNNPFRITSPKKNNISAKKDPKPSCSSKDKVKKNIFNTKRLDLTSLRSSGIFLNSSRSRLSNAAGQPRTITTYKRRLSAKDITIGPNQKVRRRRTRPQAANIEIISTQFLAPLSSGFFSIGMKNPTSVETNPNCNSQNTKANKSQIPTSLAPLAAPTPSTSKAKQTPSSKAAHPTSPKQAPTTSQKAAPTPHHGRTLRKRPVKPSPNKSSCKTSANTSMQAEDNPKLSASSPTPPTMQDLQQSVNKYFGAANRIASGEEFKICGKRTTRNGEVQFLIEWGE